MKKSRAKQIGYILLSVILLLILAGCAGRGGQETTGNPFDFYIDLTTKEDIEGLADESFVEGVFSFTLMTFQRPGYDVPMSGQMALLAAPSFEGIDASPYHHAAMVKEDRAIMEDSSKNPILISSDLARAGNYSVGDAFYQGTNASEEPLSFTVAGIFRQEPLFAQFEAVALINSQITAVFSDKVDELGYTNAYVKASDPAALKKYFDEEFIPHLQLKGLSEEVIAQIPKEDLKAYYEEYDAHMKRMK